MSIRPHMDLGRQPPTAASHCFLLAPTRSCRMLVHADARAINEVHRPLQHVGLVSLPEQRRQHALPDARLTPAIEAICHRFPGAKALRQIAPRDAGFPQPQEPIEDTPMVMIGAAPPARALWWQERLDPCPLVVGQFMSSHA